MDNQHRVLVGDNDHFTCNVSGVPVGLNFKHNLVSKTLTEGGVSKQSKLMTSFKYRDIKKTKVKREPTLDTLFPGQSPMFIESLAKVDESAHGGRSNRVKKGSASQSQSAKRTTVGNISGTNIFGHIIASTAEQPITSSNSSFSRVVYELNALAPLLEHDPFQPSTQNQHVPHLMVPNIEETSGIVAQAQYLLHEHQVQMQLSTMSSTNNSPHATSCVTDSDVLLEYSRTTCTVGGQSNQYDYSFVSEMSLQHDVSRHVLEVEHQRLMDKEYHDSLHQFFVASSSSSGSSSGIDDNVIETIDSFDFEELLHTSSTNNHIDTL
ncbi:hypothetical protein SAMD00019534_043660 [Acytostelium subglobosum LB1]|uniref:hypothetical protein n=1 Tax=Acytostelium subglobosum LB1 TaxID=1410327 RepID=UPI00064519D3|nr:hypothetical protein SAMD00019534_043660 [Acytostelium subglobosum LB1]GAM21191.1 hypothetical protein SAMD00019534_043660 [Acytostelium subglobosum LB1]|eukprot:XP_012756325.1 hypothetical protein SAMD00019534_043660 [Acytostelium subglobosum LB1]